MRVWLVAFIALFAAVELFQWVLQLPSVRPSGVWLVVGGMGLAAASNFGRLAGSSQEAVKGREGDKETGNKGEQIAQSTASAVSPTAPAKPDESDTISFKVRPMKR